MTATRRLSAILAADVAEYSRLMGSDEEGTHERLKTHLRELVNPKIGEHRGRIVKNTGDGLLAKFASVVDAVRYAVEIQRGMAGREPEVPEERRIEFRIGINLGDVIVDEHDIFGDGVNVAARLEALAEPGGICGFSGFATTALLLNSTRPPHPGHCRCPTSRLLRCCRSPI
jgi:adenylate cyclase